MVRTSMVWFTLLVACGGASRPASSPTAQAAQGPEAAPVPTGSAAAPAEAPGRDYQEALRCDEECLMTAEGDEDTLEARCREQCGLPSREP